METGEPYHLPPERPEEHVYPYASPLEELFPADTRIEEVKEEKKDPVSSDAGGYPASSSGLERKSHREKKKVEWPPLSPGFEDVEVVLLAGDIGEALKKSKYSKMFHRAF